VLVHVAACSSDVVVAFQPGGGAAGDAGIVDASTSQPDASTFLTGCFSGTEVTSELLVVDAGSNSILRISQQGEVSVAAGAVDIQAVTGMAPDLSLAGIATLVDGSFVFSDPSASSTAVRVHGDGSMEVVLDISGVRPQGLAAHAGDIFVLDDRNELLQRLDLATGDFGRAVIGVGDFPENIDVNNAITPHNGVIYVGSRLRGGSVYRLNLGGFVEKVTEGDPFQSLDGAMVSGTGSLFVTDNAQGGAGFVVEVDSSDVASVWLTQAQLIAATGQALASLRGGIARDTAGRLYLADSASQSILRVEANKATSVWVDSAALLAATGVTPNLVGSMAFERSCQ
jgi:hypothetical protein